MATFLTPDRVQALVSLGWLMLALGVCVFAAPLLQRVVRERAFTVEIAGIKLSAQNATENITTAIKDLQESVRRLEEARAQPGAAAAPVAPDTEEARVRAAAAGKTILWVDDRPENNALIVEKLRETGFAVDAAISTRDGVRLYKRRRYDIVLSDMGRRESGRDVPDAGVQLIQELRSLGAQEPIIVYCSTRASDNFGVRARSAGATSVTSSTTELYRQIQAAAAKEDEVGG